MEQWRTESSEKPGDGSASDSALPDSLILIAGQAAYPLLLARAARRQGVRRIIALAFKGETRKEIRDVADEVIWLHVGSLNRFLETIQSADASCAVMAGQIAPHNLFNLRMDRAMIDALKAMPMKNAHTIFGELIRRIEQTGVKLLPAGLFMQDHMPGAGLLTSRAPDEREAADIAIGRRVIKDTSHLDIGQTVLVKEGMVLAVEAFEGTNRAIRRGGTLGGPGAVVVKVPKVGHDMRFDIPVIGLKTLKVIKKARVSCLAIEAGGAILLDQDTFLSRADAMGLTVTVLEKQDALSLSQSDGRIQS